MSDHVHPQGTGYRGYPSQHNRQFTVAEGLRDRDVPARGRCVGEHGCGPDQHEQRTQLHDEGEAAAHGGGGGHHDCDARRPEHPKSSPAEGTEHHSSELPASLPRGIRGPRDLRSIHDVKPPTASPLARFVISGVADLSSALAHQSLLVAAVWLLADVAAFLTAGPVSQFRAVDWAVLAAVALVDAALALPARLSGWVALAHAEVRIAAAGLLGGSTFGAPADNAGFLIAGYRAGAWLRGRAAYMALAVLALGIGGACLFSGGSDGGVLPVEVLKNAF